MNDMDVEDEMQGHLREVHEVADRTADRTADRAADLMRQLITFSRKQMHHQPPLVLLLRLFVIHMLFRRPFLVK